MSIATDAIPETISMQGLADAFKRIHDTMPDRRFAFVLGAGASKSSGIKLASEMVADWIVELHRASATANGMSKSEWANAANLKISDFDPSNPAASYSAMYQRMYQDDPEQGFAYLEDQMAKAEPSYGYSVVGRIMADTRHRAVITVNFDNLVADSLSIFSTTYPLVCGHESLAQFARAELRRPLVLKVHRDLLIQPKSVPAELASVAPQFNDVIIELLQKYTPIVLGYGGNDDSLMGSLESIPKHKIPGGVFWCYREADGPPPQRIQNFVAKQRGKLVPIMGFDELMVLLEGVLLLGKPDELIAIRAQGRVKKLQQHEKELRQKLEETASKATPVAKEAESVLRLLTEAISKFNKEKPWWLWEREASAEADFAKRDVIYRNALDALPWSVQLMNNYALFLTEIRKSHDIAEAIYKRAIEIDPKSAAPLTNYGNLLTSVRKNHDAAQDLYQRAIEADPTYVSALGNYAFFLTSVRKEHDAAQVMYERAIEVDSKNSAALRNYAIFLTRVRQDHDEAQIMYQRAIDADPTNVSSLRSYADFLANVRKEQHGARLLYERVIGSNPKDAAALGSYAAFLFSVLKDYDSAQIMFQRAIDADANEAYALNNYAAFLSFVRHDHNVAQKMFERAIEADPTDEAILCNYATFLYEIRKDPDAAQVIYQRAIECNPTNARTLARYSLFLSDIRNDHDAAITMCKQAIELDPQDSNLASIYTRLLLTKGLVHEGRAQLSSAFALFAPDKNPDKKPELNAENWMYAYCCRDALEQPPALTELKVLISQDVRTGEWDFSGVIAQAVKMQHAHSQWLPKLAEVLAGRAEVDTLSEWIAWRDA